MCVCADGYRSNDEVRQVRGCLGSFCLSVCLWSGTTETGGLMMMVLLLLLIRWSLVQYSIVDTVTLFGFVLDYLGPALVFR